MVTLRPRRTKEPPAKEASKIPAATKKSRTATSKMKKAAPLKVQGDTRSCAEGDEKSKQDLAVDSILQVFLDKVSPDPKKSTDITRLHELIRRNAPELTPELQGTSTLAYGGFDYQTKSNCSGRWARLGIMVNKTGLSIMVSGEKDGKYLLEHYDKKAIAKKSSAVSLGKSCIRFRTLEDLKLNKIEEILQAAAEADVSSIAVA